MKHDREAAQGKIRTKAPFIFYASATDDMGAEFSAVVPEGVIFAEPGMMLDFSDNNGSYFGDWPPLKWDITCQEQHSRCMNDFLTNDFWNVTPWEKVDDDLVFALAEFLNEPEYFNLNSYESD